MTCALCLADQKQNSAWLIFNKVLLVNAISCHSISNLHALYRLWVMFITDLKNVSHHSILSGLDPGAFSDAVHSRGAALDNFFGFIDGTVRPVARPSRNQNVLFSGHNRVHCLKFQVWYFCYMLTHMNKIIFLQSLVTPNGLIAHLFGPIEGKRHDAFMLSESGLSSKLVQSSKWTTIYCIWWSRLWNFQKHPHAISWSSANCCWERL